MPRARPQSPPAAHAAAGRRLRYPRPYLRSGRRVPLRGGAHLHAAGFDARRLSASARRRSGVDRAVLVQPSVYGTDNRALLDALSRRRQGLRGVAVVEAGYLHGRGHARWTMPASAACASIWSTTTGERNVVPEDVVRRSRTTIAPFGWHIEFLVNLDEAPSFAAGDRRVCRSTSWSGISAIRRAAPGRGRMRRASTPSCGCSRPAAAGSS